MVIHLYVWLLTQFDWHLDKPVPISWPHRGDITFENVSLRYENHNENIITNLNLVIPAGQRLGICGKSGSGKSTLALALFRVVDIVSGHIFIDDVNIATIHPDEIRTRLSIIPQDVMLFNGTIRENLDPSNHYTDLDLWNSLEMAQLKQTIVSMPAGLDTMIADNGSNVFSGGEKQLFCLARAVLRGSVCLLLDEPTATLDTTTETALLEAANKAFHGRTIITIAVSWNEKKKPKPNIICIEYDFVCSGFFRVRFIFASIHSID